MHRVEPRRAGTTLAERHAKEKSSQLNAERRSDDDRLPDVCVCSSVHADQLHNERAQIASLDRLPFKTRTDAGAGDMTASVNYRYCIEDTKAGLYLAGGLNTPNFQSTTPLGQNLCYVKTGAEICPQELLSL